MITSISRRTAPLLIVGAVVSVAIGLLIFKRDEVPCLGTYVGATLVGSLLDISQTTTSLKLLNGKEDPKLKGLLEWRLASAIQSARHAIENQPVMDPVSLPGLVVNFRHEIQEARTYIVDHQLKTVSLLAEGDTNPLRPLDDLRLIDEWFSRQPLPPGSGK